MVFNEKKMMLNLEQIFPNNPLEIYKSYFLSGINIDGKEEER